MKMTNDDWRAIRKLQPRDVAAQMLEGMSQRDIRQLMEYCFDHLDDPGEIKKLQEYASLAVWAADENPPQEPPGVDTSCPLSKTRASQIMKETT